MFGQLKGFSDKIKDQVTRYTNKPVLIVEAHFYPEIAENLAKGAIQMIESANLRWERFVVPGAFEIPATIAMAAVSRRYSAYVALGCVIRGETSHYDYVCSESARGLNELAIRQLLPIGYGIITAENKEQADVRADLRGHNVGGRAAAAAINMLNAKAHFHPPPRKIGEKGAAA